jgi:gas vesicle protein
MRIEWAFLAGVSEGAIVALMVAPQSGKVTQELVTSKFKRGLDEVASTGKRVRAQVKDLANRGKETVAEAINVGSEPYRTSGIEG